MKIFKLLTGLLATALLCGCGPKEELPQVDGPQYWEESPRLTYGVWETDKLEVLPWYGGRAEATTDYRMVETELGYYLLWDNLCLYADKADLNNWVPLCNKPNCGHRPYTGCNAYLSHRTLLMKNGRLMTDIGTNEVPELYQGDQNGSVLISLAPDGTDRRLEQVYPELLVSGGWANGYYSPREWVYFQSALQPDGTNTNTVYCVVDGAVQILNRITGVDPTAVSHHGGIARSEFRLYGDRYYYHGDLDPDYTKYFRVENGELCWIDLDGLSPWCGYISGETLRVFRSNDGYYDIDLTTRESVKVADAQLENSFASVVLPNCVIESTLHLGDGSADWDPVTSHSCRLFDGEQWRDVALPDELRLSTNAALNVYSVNSDCIFIRSWIAGVPGLVLYRIDLTQENLILEFCGTVTTDGNFW